MKLFQIITLDGEFQGKFSVEFKKSNGDLEDHDVEITPTIDDLNVFYCNGLTWQEQNPTGIDDNRIKEILLSNFDKVYQTFKYDDVVIKINDDEIVKYRVYINKQDREIYESIRKHDGDLKGISNMELFLIAMLLGFNKKGKHGLKGVKSTANDGLVRIESFPDVAWDIIKSIAVYEEEYMEVLMSNNVMFDIAEKYASVGIHELNNIYFENEHNFFKRFESLLLDYYERLSIDLNDE